MIADLALFTYLTIGAAVGCMALHLGIVRAVLIAALWPVAAAVEIGERAAQAIIGRRG